MLNLFERFREWVTDDVKEDGCRAIREDAPQEIKEEAKRVDKLHFERTGRHMIHFDSMSA